GFVVRELQYSQRPADITIARELFSERLRPGDAIPANWNINDACARLANTCKHRFVLNSGNKDRIPTGAQHPIVSFSSAARERNPGWPRVDVCRQLLTGILDNCACPPSFTVHGRGVAYHVKRSQHSRAGLLPQRSRSVVIEIGTPIAHSAASVTALS